MSYPFIINSYTDFHFYLLLFYFFLGRVPEEAPISEEEQKILNVFREKEGANIDKHGISLMTQLRFIRGFNQDANPEEKSLQMFSQMLVG